MLKPGKFLCKVTAPTNGWFGEAGDNNTPYLRLPLIVTEEGECEGSETTWQGWLTDKSLDRTCKNLAEVFGWDGDLEALAKLTRTGPFVGRECRITVEEEEYNGKKKLVIRWLNRAEGGGKSMPTDAALTLAKRLQERAMKSAASAENPAPKAKVKPQDPDLDPSDPSDPDQIPF